MSMCVDLKQVCIAIMIDIFLETKIRSILMVYLILETDIFFLKKRVTNKSIFFQPDNNF